MFDLSAYNPYLLNSFSTTFVLATISITLTRLLNKTWVSAALTYWSGWLFVIFSTLICELYGWNYRSSTAFGNGLIIELSRGAFLGFLIASLFSFLLGKKHSVRKKALLIDTSEAILAKFSTKILSITFILGFVELALNISKVGLNAGTMFNLRQIYLERNFSLLSWMGTHVSSISAMMIILAGAIASVRGLSLKQILLYSGASAPLGLAKASRIFLIAFILLYLFSFISMRAALPIKARFSVVKDEALKLLYLLFSMLMIFAFLGFSRATNEAMFNPAKMILTWPSSSIAALDSWSNRALIAPRTNGVNIFQWPATLLSKLGLIDIEPYQQVVKDSVTFFQSTSDSAAVIPRTVIPDLIFDFGISGVFWGMLVIGFFLQLISIRCSGQGIFQHVLSALCLQAAFMTTQGTIFSPGICIIVFWAGVLSFYVAYLQKKQRFASTSPVS